MGAIEIVAEAPIARAIGWALVQFVWQGALVGALTACVLACLRRGAADVRYVVSCLGLVLMITLPIVTVIEQMSKVRDRQRMDPVATAASSRSVASDALAASTPSRAAEVLLPSTLDRTTATARIIDLEPWLPAAVLVWIAGVTLLSVRLAAGWIIVERLRRRSTRAVASSLASRVARMARRLRVTRPVRALESAIVDVPTVVGWLRPVILLPTSALAGLSPAQLEAVIAHELAHVRRHDYLVNLLQTVVETLLFYHPAVWWLSHRIRIEREHCCDDLAVELCGDRVAYARALADLEELRGVGPAFAVAVTGGSLVARVRRLLGLPASHDRRSSAWVAIAALVAVIGLAFAEASPATVTLPDDQSPAPTAPSRPKAATPAKAPTHVSHPSAPDVRAPGPTPLFDTDDAIAQEPPVPPEPPEPPEPPAPPEPPEPPLPPVPPQPQSPPVPPAPPSPPVPPAPPSPSESSISLRDGEGHISWSSNGEKLDVRYRGTITLSDDDRDIARISPGGYFVITDGAWFSTGNKVELRGKDDGTIERRFSSGWRERSYDPEGRQWLAEALQRLVRRSGFAAEARVARILKAQGPPGVLAEISRLETDYVRSVYYRHLLNQAELTGQQVATTLSQAGREISSSYELSRVLTKAADRAMADDAARKAYFDAAAKVASDYEMQRVLAAALSKPGLPSAVVAQGLAAAKGIDSDYELARLLVTTAKVQTLDKTTQGPFFDALSMVESDYEHRRVLAAVTDRGGDPPFTAAMLASASLIDSDYELSRVLTQVIQRGQVEGSREAFFRAVDSLESGYERRRVLGALADTPNLSTETLTALLKAAAATRSDYDLAQILLRVAERHKLQGPLREAYLDAADRISSQHEQGRVLVALVKNERGK